MRLRLRRPPLPALDTKDRLVVAGTVTGFVGFTFSAPGFVFLCAVAFGLLALHLFTEART